MEGDLNSDDIVDELDLAIVENSYDLCEGDEGFDTRADTNDDGCVDLFDLVFVLQRQGNTCPIIETPTVTPTPTDTTLVHEESAQRESFSLDTPVTIFPTHSPTAASPDWSTDDFVNEMDLLGLLHDLRNRNEDLHVPRKDLEYDINGDGKFDYEDLFLFSQDWYALRDTLPVERE